MPLSEIHISLASVLIIHLFQPRTALVVSTPSTQRRTPSTLMLSPRTPGTAGRRNKVTPRKQHASKACKENHPVPNKLHINTTAENQQSNRPKSATLCKVPQSDR